MAGTTITQDGDGAVISITESPCIATISFGRKVGLPAYSNEEMSLFLQVPLDDVSSLDAIEAQLDPHVAFLKSYVYKQLGVLAEITPEGVVAGELPTEAPKGRSFAKSKPSSATATKHPTKGVLITTSDNEKEELWAALAGASKHGENFKDQQGETIWDNRVKKRNSKGPDFKWADSAKSLWLADAPEWFTEPGGGISI